MTETYPIGTQYKAATRRYPYVCTVTDILRTYNAQGELVRVRYVAQHDFAGQPVTDTDVLPITIARGLLA